MKEGHEVLFSSRDPSSLKLLVDQFGPKARGGNVEKATAFGDAILLAVPYEVYPQIGRDYGAALNEKIVLHAGNTNRSSLYQET